jgi:hypothetical protein
MIPFATTNAFESIAVSIMLALASSPQETVEEIDSKLEHHHPEASRRLFALMPFLRKLSAWFALSAVVLWATPQVAFDDSAKTGVIQVTVVDSFGYPLPYAAVALDRDGQTRRTAKVGKSEALPYGRYRISAAETNYASSTVEIDLREAYATVVIGLVPQTINALHDGSTIKGTIEHADPDCRLVRVVPLFTNGPAYDAIVLQNQFLVDGAKAGRYAVAVTGSSGVCRFAQISVGLGSRIVSVTIP